MTVNIVFRKLEVRVVGFTQIDYEIDSSTLVVSNYRIIVLLEIFFAKSTVT